MLTNLRQERRTNYFAMVSYEFMLQESTLTTKYGKG